jgi:hypothetical protein
LQKFLGCYIRAEAYGWAPMGMGVNDFCHRHIKRAQNQTPLLGGV